MSQKENTRKRISPRLVLSVAVVEALSPLPFEQEQVEVVVLLGEEVAKDTSRIPRSDLVCRQSEVHTLDEIPQLGSSILGETPVTYHNNGQ